jgi:hypothetical protein
LFRGTVRKVGAKSVMTTMPDRRQAS